MCGADPETFHDNRTRIFGLVFAEPLMQTYFMLFVMDGTIPTAAMGFGPRGFKDDI